MTTTTPATEPTTAIRSGAIRTEAARIQAKRLCPWPRRSPSRSRWHFAES